jgi:hypothetical protein
MFFHFAQAETTHVAYWFNQGFAVLVVVALGWALYGWIRWAGSNVLVPLKDAGVEHLKETTATMRQLQTTLADQHGDIRELRSTAEVLDERTNEILAALKRQA